MVKRVVGGVRRRRHRAGRQPVAPAPTAATSGRWRAASVRRPGFLPLLPRHGRRRAVVRNVGRLEGGPALNLRMMWTDDVDRVLADDWTTCRGHRMPDIRSMRDECRRPSRTRCPTCGGSSRAGSTSWPPTCAGGPRAGPRSTCGTPHRAASRHPERQGRGPRPRPAAQRRSSRPRTRGPHRRDRPGRRPGRAGPPGRPVRRGGRRGAGPRLSANSSGGSPPAGGCSAGSTP